MTRDVRKEAEDYLQRDGVLSQEDDERTVVQRAAEITRRAKERDAIHGREPGEMGSADTRGQENDDEEGVPGVAISDDQFDRMKNTDSITCPNCRLTSYNPHDIEMGYCGNCHAYTGVVNPLAQAKRIVREQHESTRELVEDMRMDTALDRVTGDPSIPRPSDEQ